MSPERIFNFMTDQTLPSPEKLVDLSDLVKLPRPLMSLVKGPVESLLGLTHINDYYTSIQHLPRPERETRFFELSVEGLNLKYEVDPEGLARIPKQGPLVVVANHPHGMADGIILGDLLSGVRSDFKLMANEQLKMCPELAGWIIAVNPFNTLEARRRNLAGLRESLAWLRKGGVLVTFPAGSASTFSMQERRVMDGVWNSNIAALIKKTGASVVPMHLSGRNSLLFQTVSVLKREARVAFLPRELKRNGRITQTIQVGDAMGAEEFGKFGSAEELVADLRRRTDALGRRI